MGVSYGLHKALHNRFESNVAIPRKDMNPATSVTVVRIIDEDCVGFWPIRVSVMGINAPAISAATVDITIDTRITRESP